MRRMVMLLSVVALMVVMMATSVSPAFAVTPGRRRTRHGNVGGESVG